MSSEIKKTRYSKNRNAVYAYTDPEFIKLVAESKSSTEILRKMNLSTNGGNARDILKQRYTNLELDISHFNRLGTVKRNIGKKYTCVEDTCFKGSGASNRRIIEILKESTSKKYICEDCGCGSTWNGKPITLQLHHIDGDNANNEVLNLQFLCPNCHTQTDNYGSKNKEDYGRPPKATKNIISATPIILPKSYLEYSCNHCHVKYFSGYKGSKYCSQECSIEAKRYTSIPKKDELHKLILENPNFVALGKMFKVSAATVRNWCKYYNLPHTSAYYRNLKQN